MTKSNESLSQRLKRLRLRNKLTIQEVANQVGVAVSTYREWEYGRHIRGEPYAKLAEMFNVTIYELITGLEPSSRRSVEFINRIQHNVNLLRSEIENQS